MNVIKSLLAYAIHGEESLRPDASEKGDDVDSRQWFDLRLVAELIVIVTLLLGGVTAFIQTQDAVIVLEKTVNKHEIQQEKQMSGRKTQVDRELASLRAWTEGRFVECSVNRGRVVAEINERLTDKLESTRELMETKLGYYIPIIVSSAKKLDEGDRFTEKDASVWIDRIREIGTDQDEVQRLNERQDARLDHLETSMYGGQARFRFRGGRLDPELNVENGQ